MKRIAIIGGGISGLTAAFYLERLKRGGAPLEYTLFEASPRLGGVIQTEHTSDFVIEAGPDSFLTAKPWAFELARDAGIADRLILSNDRKRKTYVLDRGELIPIPDGMQMMVPTAVWPVITSSLFSSKTKARMMREYLSPPEPLLPDKDESVASFVSRHFGEEVVAKLAAPMLAGIYGGDANTLSARAALPRLIAMEAEHRSLVRGTLRAISQQNNAEPKPLFTSFRNGMQQLVDAVVASIDPKSIRVGSPVESLRPTDAGWRLISVGNTELFEKVILAAPAYIAAQLMSFDTALASQLGSIRYADSVTVSLVYLCEKLRRCTQLPQGFGFLVPRSEGKQIIACTFVQNKFDSRAGDDHFLVRAFLSSGLERNDAQLIALVESELSSILGIHVPTEFARVYRWAQAMPQYEVGHLEKVAQIDKAVKAHSGLHLIGNAYRGLGIPDCIREGKAAAARAAAN